MTQQLLVLKDEHSYLKDAPSQVLQQALRDLDTAYSRAFDKNLAAHMPRYKKKHRGNGIRFPQGFKLDGKGVFLPKLGWIGFRKSREIDGVVKNVTVAQRAGVWYVTMQTEREVAEPVHPSQTEIGIDVGITQFATCSDGSVILGVNALAAGYKLAWRGGALTLVPPQYTSQACSQCNFTHKDNRKTQARFHCLSCGHRENADVNAARNIVRRAGHARIACGDTPVGVSAKQETQLASCA